MTTRRVTTTRRVAPKPRRRRKEPKLSGRLYRMANKLLSKLKIWH